MMTEKEKQRFKALLNPDKSGKLDSHNFINCLIIMFGNVKALHAMCLETYRLKVKYSLYGFDFMYCANQAWKQINN